MTATAPRPDFWLCRPLGRAAPWWRVVVEFKPPSCAALLRAMHDPHGDRILTAAIIHIRAPKPVRTLIRLTRRRPLKDGADAAIAAALPQFSTADGDAGEHRRPRQPAVAARRAEALYLAGLCEAYGWTPAEARALTPREMLLFHSAALYHADLRFARQAALKGVRTPPPPPLRLDARDIAAAKRADERARKRRPPRDAHIDAGALNELLNAIGTMH